MIKTFRSKSLQAFWQSGNSSKLSVQNTARIRRLLLALDAATASEDLNLPGAFFHHLQGNPVRYSVRISGNWRLTWAWESGAVAVDLEDYH